MGADGGYLPVRCDLMKLKPKEKKIDAVVKARNKAKLCQLSKERLKKPVVMCRLGNFYNYESLLTHLMNKTLPDDFQHIKKIKRDVKQVRLTENEDKKSEIPFMCPLSKIEFNGLNKFVGLWDCGCVFSEQLIKNVKDTNCPVCTTKFTDSQVINLIMTDEAQNDLFNKIIQDGKKKDKKKQEKQKIKEEEEQEGCNEGEKIQKKVKKEEKQKEVKQTYTPKLSLIQKLAKEEVEKSKKNQQFAELVHDKYEEEDLTRSMFRNTRHGFR